MKRIDSIPRQRRDIQKFTKAGIGSWEGGETMGGCRRRKEAAS